MSSFSQDCFVFGLRYTKVKLDLAILPGVHVTGVVKQRIKPLGGSPSSFKKLSAAF